MQTAFKFSKEEVNIVNEKMSKVFPVEKFDEKELIKVKDNSLTLETGKEIVRILNRSSYGYTRTRVREISRSLKTIHSRVKENLFSKSDMPYLIAAYEESIIDFYEILKTRKLYSKYGDGISLKPFLNRRVMGFMIYALSLKEVLIRQFFLDLFENLERFSHINRAIKSISSQSSKSNRNNPDALEECEFLMIIALIWHSEGKSITNSPLSEFTKAVVQEGYRSGHFGEWKFPIKASLLHHLA